jgi:hypothetical protein
MTTAAERADAVVRLEALARCGVTVSVCCAPRDTGGCSWSVLASSADAFMQPPAEFESLAIAVAYVAHEALARGWLFNADIQEDQSA